MQMRKDQTGIKYFPINLQKKTMIYSGSQPQINFNPPSKAVMINSNIKNESFKIKKDYSINKSDNKIGNSNYYDQGINLNKSSNLSKNKPPSRYDEQQPKVINSLYKKMNKNPNDYSNDNYFENMLGGSSNYNNSYKINDKNFTNDLQNSINKSKIILNKDNNNTKNSFYNNVNVNKNSYLNQNQGNVNVSNVNKITNEINQNYNNKSVSSILQGSNYDINYTRNHNNVINKQQTPIINKTIKKEVNDRDSKENTHTTKFIRDKSYEPATLDSTNSYKLGMTNSIRPSSKLAKIAETNMKNSSDSMREKDDSKSNTFKDKSYSNVYSINKMYYDKKKMPDSLKNSQKDLIKVDQPTTKEFKYKEETLLGNYQKMIKKDNNNNKPNNLNFSDDYFPINNSVNINNNSTSIHVMNNELKSSIDNSKQFGDLKDTINKNTMTTTLNSVNRDFNKFINNSKPKTVNTNNTNTNMNISTNNIKHESFVKRIDPDEINNKNSSIQEEDPLLNSPENMSSNTIGEHQIVKKSIKHYHQKSLSDNANIIDGFSYGNKKVKPTEVYDLELEKVDEEHILNSAKIPNHTQIRNVLKFVQNFIFIDEKLEQNLIEKQVNEILNEIFKSDFNDYECFSKNSKSGLNKYLNRIFKYYYCLAMLFKFGILEFLLNNILQKKIRTILKLFNICMIDFLYSTVICRIKNENNKGKFDFN